MQTTDARTVAGGIAERFEAEGFAVIDRLVSADAVDQLRGAYDDLTSGRVKAKGDRMLGGITRQVMSPSSAHPVFDDNAALDIALEISRVLLGTDDVARVYDMLITKPPGHGEPTPWHQDMSYSQMPFAPAGLAIPLDTIQFWVALDDVDVENGCMQFLPGQHKRPLLPHVVASGEPDDEGRLLAIDRPEDHVDLSSAFIAEIPAGGCTLHSYGTPHYTPPNRSADRQRRAYIFSIAPRRTWHDTGR